jgi:NAD(P)-dependent dehydrogenase (short-subunit alcohol dehydrogenase family)
MAKQPRILVGQVAAVTGGARGIGRATVEALAREGLKVAIGDLDVALAERAAAEIGPDVVAFELDVTQRASFEAFTDAVEERLGPLDVLVNNAGIMALGRFADESDESAQRTIDINLHGVIFGTKIALERMGPRNRGHIVNIASQAGKYGAPGGATYSATKHAVIGLTEAIRGELHAEGSAIELSYVMPYLVNTDLVSGTQRAHGLKNLEPTDVADAIVDALRHGVVDVWVPRSLRHTHRLSALLPRATNERILRAMKADRVLLEADPSARRGYELRAAHSEPALDEADEPRQLTS